MPTELARPWIPRCLHRPQQLDRLTRKAARSTSAARTSGDHEQTCGRKGPLTWENAGKPSRARVTTARFARPCHTGSHGRRGKQSSEIRPRRRARHAQSCARIRSRNGRQAADLHERSGSSADVPVIFGSPGCGRWSGQGSSGRTSPSVRAGVHGRQRGRGQEPAQGSSRACSVRSPRRWSRPITRWPVRLWP